MGSHYDLPDDRQLRQAVLAKLNERILNSAFGEGVTKLELLEPKDEIIANHEKLMAKEKKAAPNRPLA